MSHQMTKFADGFAWLLWPFRQHHAAVAKVSLLCLSLLGGLDYGYKVHGRDLLWWRTQMATFSPLSLLLCIISAKVYVILVLAVVSCIRSLVVKNDPRREDLTIMCARRRYCRFLVMQLLGAFHDMVLEPETMDLVDYLQRHATFANAVQHFRCQARKIFERTQQQVHRPQHEVLYVDDLLEAELLNRGYADGLAELSELDIHWMVYGAPA